jgi:hypothetical protein
MNINENDLTNDSTCNDTIAGAASGDDRQRGDSELTRPRPPRPPGLSGLPLPPEPDESPDKLPDTDLCEDS